MYNVMLVDDDYPVLELLSEAIPWEELGLALSGTLENGEAALERADAEGAPDILITDIGMPRLNGLELIKALKEKRPAMKVAILSCHNEFHYAQQALKLNVQDYILKETLDPADLIRLLKQFRAELDQERQMDRHRRQLQHLVDRNRMELKSRFIRKTVREPILRKDEWFAEAASYGLSLEGGACLPVLGAIDRYPDAIRRYLSGDVLRFAVDNVLEEMLREADPRGVHFFYDDRRFVLLFPHLPSLKVNMYDRAAAVVRRLQAALCRTIRVSYAFRIGDLCASPSELKSSLHALLDDNGQRFYMAEGAIERIGRIEFSRDDLYSWYAQASEEFRDMLIDKRTSAVEPTVAKWMSFIRERQFPPDTVKDWTLKLLLDLKLKLQSLQQFRSYYTVDVLHKEILEMDSLAQLQDWLIAYFREAVPVAGGILEMSTRSEVLDAQHYVSQHLHKKIALEEIAGHLHLNPSYFSRLFKKETGETFIEYVTRMKMERAKELLDQTNLSVNRICEMLGYDNQSYFIKTFKSATGHTPLEYRGRQKK
ncbi:AraC family transcriptional regulator [Paenibacillus thermoaerophilus]|uniref:AraC family transcriptional regulator n=1 Tax=Paenibacillus thermoaerophilus TaxID=1215385 RepID=A0ABW2V3N8_9BACL|nr:AraC family transcriptional regulator [Paenibacillus thermoaerophilus]TMV18440.1 AraC family transcriptional regulator [Paenibacillus thermoaerophilus]